MAWLGEAAHWLGLVPLAWLAVRRSKVVAHWLIACVFGVSFVADSLAHVFAWQAISLAYPVSQAALVAMVFRPREECRAALIALLIVGLAAVWGLPHPDLLLRTVAWGLILRIVWPLPIGRLRGALLVTFGLGLLSWYGFAFAPSWGTWLAFQGTRVAGTALFCRATGGDDG